MTQSIFIIDTNVFISGLLSSQLNSPTVSILDDMLSNSMMYILSPALLQEYQMVLQRPKITKLHGLTEIEIEQLLNDIVANAIWREPTTRHPAPDSGDDHLWSLLLQFEDTLLVTGDRLLINKPPPDKSVITPASYIKLFSS